jgi:hypothetical protein
MDMLFIPEHVEKGRKTQETSDSSKNDRSRHVAARQRHLQVRSLIIEKVNKNS